jgi:hypothetical protein
LTVKSDPLELEVPFCVVAVLPWKDIASFKVMSVEMMIMMQDERKSKVEWREIKKLR